MNHSHQRIGEEKISKLLMEFSIPAIIGMLVSALYNVVDRIFIGNAPGIGAMGIAGVTIGMPIMLFMMALGMLNGVGGGTLTAIRLGEGNRKEAEQILGNSLISVVSLALIFVIAGLIFLDPLLRLFGASEAVMPYARDYMSIILFGGLFQPVTMCMNNFIRVDGQPKTAMTTMLIGAVANAMIVPVFIFVFGWGIKGAAAATVMSQFLSLSWTMRYFLSGKSNLKIIRKNLVPDFHLISRTMTMGAPNFLMQLAGTVVNIIMNLRLSQLGGDIAISGIGTINSLMGLMVMPVIGINQGTQPIVGFNYGAKKFSRVKETLKLSITASVSVTTFFFLISQIFPMYLVALFNREPDFLNFTTGALRAMTLMLPVVGFQVISSNYFLSTGKPTLAALLTLSRQVIVLIPAILILSLFWGVQGVVYATPLADFLAAALTAVLFTRSIRRDLQT